MQSDNEAPTTTDGTSKRLDDLLEAGSTLMVGTTAPGGRLEFRPLTELWNRFAAVYFERGRDTPSIAVLTIDSREGRYWSTTSGRLGSLISMVRAAVGHPESSGEHGDLDLTWQRSR